MGEKRAVITGMGAISCIGNTLDEISNSLRKGISGISKNEEYDALGFRSKISGSLNIDIKDLIDRKLLRFCLLYTSPSPRDYAASRMPSSA